MSSVEQVATLVGGPVIIIIPLVAAIALDGVIGTVVAGVGFIVAITGFFAVKAWLWKHTIYPDGWMSATFVWNPDDYPEDMQ